MWVEIIAGNGGKGDFKIQMIKLLGAGTSWKQLYLNPVNHRIWRVAYPTSSEGRNNRLL